LCRNADGIDRGLGRAGYGQGSETRYGIVSGAGKASGNGYLHSLEGIYGQNSGSSYGKYSTTDYRRGSGSGYSQSVSYEPTGSYGYYGHGFGRSFSYSPSTGYGTTSGSSLSYRKGLVSGYGSGLPTGFGTGTGYTGGPHSSGSLGYGYGSGAFLFRGSPLRFWI